MAHGVSLFRMLSAVLLLWTAEAQADRLASYRAGGHDIVLMTQRCKAATDTKAQRAYKRAGGRSVLEGCWSATDGGNPVVTWRNGQVQELDESKLRLAPKYAALLREEPPAARGPGRRFARPAWCKDARFPHERLICRNPELSATDLALATLWRAYRTRLKPSPLEVAGHKSDFFRRLKACGAHKECIAAEQAARMRFYREALATQ